LTLEDAEAVARLTADCEEAEDGVRETTVEDIRALWGLPDRDLATQSLGVYHDDRLAASFDVRGEHSEGDVHPAFRGRGIGTALLPWTWAQARDQGAAQVGQTVTDARVDAASLFTAHGYEAAWSSWYLRMALDGLAEPAAPDGCEIRGLEYDRDALAAYTVINRAFNETRATPEDDFPSWDGFMRGHEALAPWASAVALDGDRVVGAVIGFDYGRGADAWIQQLAVEREHRGRGLGSALIAHSYARFRERGWTHGALSTDSRKTAALTLYAEVGLTVRSSSTHWMKTL
jgi:GNAT superfamily N-acetyltransferase